VSLTDEERRRLSQLADEIARDDPRLARALSSLPARRPRRRLRLPAVVLMTASIPVIVVGAVAVQTLVVAIGGLVLIVGALMFVVTLRRRFPRNRT
jgi:uncharacterized membrane protein HdeD (DUF308 family)